MAYWCWLNGNVSTAQITRDLEEMKAKGMGGAEIWDVQALRNPDNFIAAGPAFMGDESVGFIVHAIREATQLGLSLGLIASSDWNQADDGMDQRFHDDFKRAVSDQLIFSHYETGSKLLRDYGLELVAEAGGPGPPIWKTCPVDAIRATDAVDVARGEFWIAPPNIGLIKEIASAPHLYGKTLVDAESFTTWQRWSHGPHPAVPWWPMAKPWLDYLSSCSHLLRQGLFVGDVCFHYGDQPPPLLSRAPQRDAPDRAGDTRPRLRL